jgi:DNA-binding Lrp family transcriptional regulator
LASEIGLTEKGVEYHLNKLTTDGVIIREGARKTGKWIVLKKE